MALFDNTLESTSQTSLLGDAGSSGLATRLSACHSVPKTFQNAHTCRPSTACSPVTYRDTSVVLNHSSLLTFHQLTGSHIYAVTGLRLGTAGVTSPCIGTARWRKLAAPCGADETALDDATKATLAQAIRGSTDAINPFVRDAIPNTVANGTCTSTYNGVSAIGAKVNVDGECWEHSHPLYYNVYEMNQWTVEHPGNMNFAADANPIKAFAARGETTLTFPTGHAMSRFGTALPGFNLLGKFGDAVSFRNLPPSAQNAEVAAAFDALVVGQISESCGSPGEVANLPSTGNHWHSQGGVNGATGGIGHDTYTMTLSNGYHGFGHTIHWKLAMDAPDQLRQRAAHALIQIYVMSFLGTDHNWNTEIFVNYYEILVRNAFGSLRTILKEVSYSGMMASYLTFQNSASLAASGTLPDENYARESMQLFSVGLIELTEDGAYERDGYGLPIETYDTEDIGEFAKCWTGFTLRGGRGNVDIEGHSRGNRIDPMYIRGNGHDSKRDLFPKTNLHDGHLGDGYPLCADLPDRHFLAKGARWSYIGHSPGARSQPEAIHEQTKWRMHGLGVEQYRFGPNWHWTRDEAAVKSIPRIRLHPSTSPLYQQLCGNAVAGGACNFTSEVYLPSTLACDGDECAIDTVAVVDIRDPTTNETVYYEYLRPACVELTFFQPATIQGHNIRMPNGLQMCADPTTEVAAAGCCPPSHDSANSGRADCKYVNEVMSYAKAVERCAARTDGYTDVCSDRWSVTGCYAVTSGSWQGTLAEDERSWLNMENVTSCALKVQIMGNGYGRRCRLSSSSSSHAVASPPHTSPTSSPHTPWAH